VRDKGSLRDLFFKYAALNPSQKRWFQESKHQKSSAADADGLRASIILPGTRSDETLRMFNF
jgi:hypothetical protein